jgi:hypothetical protein
MAHATCGVCASSTYFEVQMSSYHESTKNFVKASAAWTLFWSAVQ